jgi:acyl-CoA thioesterase-2
VAAQALRSAGLTVPSDLAVNSLHAYFLRPGKPGQPILYSVDRIRDGRSFVTRRVVALQDGEAILNLDASFHRHEPGPEYQIPERVDVPEPETLRTSRRERHHGRPIDMREVPSPAGFTRRWIRADGDLPEDPALHACILTYASDMGAVSAASGPVSPATKMMSASLDHSMWFHRPMRADDWVFYELEAVVAARARGLARGGMSTHGGVLGVTVNQEALLRPIARPETRSRARQSP